VRAGLALCSAFGVAFFGLVSGAAAQTQSQGQALAAAAVQRVQLEFDVASVKESQDLGAILAAGKIPHVVRKVDDESFEYDFTTLLELIAYAYDVKPYQVSGPDWMKSLHFDVDAKLPDGAKKEQAPAMMQALLAERFGLQIHRDTKDLSVLALEVGKNGVKMQPSPPDAPPTDKPDDKNTTTIQGPDGSDMKVKTTGTMGQGGSVEVSGGRGGPVKVSMSNGIIHLESTKLSMDLFAQQLSGFLGQTVIDDTGLKGTWVAAIDISMDDIKAMATNAGFGYAMGGGPSSPGSTSAVPSAADPSGGSVYQSIDKLGLKLEKKKLPTGMIVVDHLEKTPTAN
jgi:uncharacterized protein (TIGR03435 family)